jgi:cytochrome c peroxidase
MIKFNKLMKIVNPPCIFVFVLAITLLNACQKDKNETTITPAVTPEMKVSLGKKIFFDKGLSNPVGQSCSSCHSSTTGFSDPNHNIISEGAVDALFGSRNAPSIGYAMFTPQFHFDNDDSAYAGGLFLDGRVNSLEEQAMKPFFNVLEMNNNNMAMLLNKLQQADYFSLYKQVYGNISDAAQASGNIADAIAAFERSNELNPFTSKYDFYLNGQASFTAQELSGLKLFMDTLKGKCANCHLTDPDPASGKILFTDFTYNNDGVPKNPGNPFYTLSSAFNPLGANYIDYGLGTILNDHTLDGAFRVASLRNIAVSGPYFHNGAFNTLEEVVHFYNTRDVPGSGFAKPEVRANVDTLETGNLKLTPREEKDIVAFLKTLTDGYK